MSVSDEIRRIQNAKANIKTSIENKGVIVPDDAKLDAFPALIDDIQSGGSGETHDNPDFYEIRTQNGTNYFNLFCGYKGTSLDLSGWNTSNVITMEYMFKECAYLTSLNVSTWDVSKVEKMTFMFQGCQRLTTIDLSNWNTENLKELSFMFNDCSSLTDLKISNLNTSKIKEISSTFKNCSSIETIDLSNWVMSNVIRSDSAFSGCSKLKTILVPENCVIKPISPIHYMFYNCSLLTRIPIELDLSDTSLYSFYLNSFNPFYGCSSLEYIKITNIYKNCTMTNVSEWSIDLSPTVIKDECLISIISELPDLINDKGLTNTSNIKLYLPKTNTLTREQVQPAIDKGWQVYNTTY